MGRFASGVAALALALAGWLPAPAGAQSLATLHVRRFSVSADRTTVHAGEPFHITLTAHVDEPVAELNAVTLPDLAGMDVSGDERRCTASQRGSDCSETITLAATIPGDRTIGPWHMDAIDANDRRPTRFSSNAIVIHVLGPSPLESIAGPLRDLAAAALSALAALAFFGILGWVFLRAFERRRARVAPAQPSAPPEPPPTPPRTSLHDLVEALAREPTRARAVAVREALRASVGAREDETYDDLVARHAIAHGPTLAAFRAVERAAFCEESGVAQAAREALPFLKD